MTQRGRIWCAAAIAATMAVAPMGARQRGPMTKGEPHAKLDVFVGRWSTQAVKPGTDEALPGTGQSVFDWTLGDVWLRESMSMEIPGAGTRNQMTLMTYDPKQERYMGSWQDNLAPRVWPFTATWTDENTLECEGQFAVGSSSVRLVVRYHMLDRDSIRMTPLQSVDGAPLKEAFAIDMRRHAE